MWCVRERHRVCGQSIRGGRKKGGRARDRKRGARKGGRIAGDKGH